MVVPQKWTGTDADRRDMKKLKLDQQLRRNFGRLAMFGFNTTLTGTWEITVITLSLSLGNGGTAGLFWNFIISFLGLSLVYLSIAELGSMIPTSGGQYYWVAILAPRSCRKPLSYITGWLCAMAWQTSIVACSFIAGTLIQALFVLNIPDYKFRPWHGTLLCIAIAAIAIIFNTFLARKLPLIEGILVFAHILGIVIVIPLLILAPRRKGGAPLIEFWNPNGWMSDGVATWIGMLSIVGSMLGYDCSIHMAEETKDSSYTMPAALLTGFVTNAALGFFAVMVCIYTIGPLDVAITQTTSGYPFIDMLYSATNSLAATDVMVSILIINFTASTIALLATASRQLWSFARNGGVPYSTFLAPATLTYDIPINALLVSLVIAILISLINIGSSAALNAIFSLIVNSIISSYWIVIACILLRRLRGPLLSSKFSLGKWGVWINTAALIYLSPIYVFAFFPATPNPTAQTMNWGIVMYGGIIIFAAIYYIMWGRKHFTPPENTFEELLEQGKDLMQTENEAAIQVRVESGDLEKEVMHEVRDGTSDM